MTITPLGFSRVSVPLQNHRATSNLHSSLSSLARYEQQIMTQFQFQYGSDSPYQANTALSILTQMDRKAQNATNLQTSLAYLGATDTTLSKLNTLTDDVRAMALDALNTSTSETQRNAIALDVQYAIQQIYSFANYSYQGRYVFSGSTTDVMPFGWGTDSYTVNYFGVTSNLNSWSDKDLLSQSNKNGVDVFGAISDPVRGTVDVNPSVTDHTLLSDLNRGLGIEKGPLRLTYGVDNKSYYVDVDLSRCVTVGDVKRELEKTNSPYFSLHVDISDRGLNISLAEGSRGSFYVSEIGKGKVARQLGIPTNKEIAAGQLLEGTDVDPRLTTTTPLSTILGASANSTLRFAGPNNDVSIHAQMNGSTFTDPKTGVRWPLNDVSFAVQSDPNISPQYEEVLYDSETRQVLIRIHPDNTTANDIIHAINQAAKDGVIPPFEASPSELDRQSVVAAGTGIISLLPSEPIVLATTDGGTGESLDLAAGLQIVNGNVTHTITFENCHTVSDFLAELNKREYGLYAVINDAGNGFDIRSRVSGTDFCIGENGGVLASQLGIRTTDLNTLLSNLDYGRGVYDYDGPGTFASAQYSGTTPNSSLLLTARQEGTDWNDYKINFVPTDPNGSVVVSYDNQLKEVTIGIIPGVTTACEVIAAFESQPGPKQFFDLTLDNSNGPNTGGGVVYCGFTTTSGAYNGGIDFTITRNDGKQLDIDVKDAVTIADVLDRINNHPDNKDGLLKATLSKYGNGIQIEDLSFGRFETRIDRALLSTAAIELGLVEPGQEYRTNTASGIAASTTIQFSSDETPPNNALLVTSKYTGSYANDVKVAFVEAEAGMPESFVWDAASKTLLFAIHPGVTTANDVIRIFQEQASDTVRAMFDIQNGMNPGTLSDPAGLPSSGTGTLSVTTGTMSGGVDRVVLGADPNPQETESLFTALIRLQVALEKNDTREIERATLMLDTSARRASYSRAEIGVMQLSLDSVYSRLAEENVQFEATLNEVWRVDQSEVSLGYLAQQLSYQATLQTTSMLFRMSLLDYL